MAHGFALEHAAAAGLDLDVSSGSVQDVVRTTHPWVQQELASRRLDIGRTRSNPLDEHTVGAADLVITMTGDHAIAVGTRFRRSLAKVFTLDHAAQLLGQTPPPRLDSLYRTPRTYPNHPGTVDIDDPIGQNDATFRRIADDIDARVRTIIAAVPHL